MVLTLASRTLSFHCGSSTLQSLLYLTWFMSDNGNSYKDLWFPQRLILWLLYKEERMTLYYVLWNHMIRFMTCLLCQFIIMFPILSCYTDESFSIFSISQVLIAYITCSYIFHIISNNLQKLHSLCFLPSPPRKTVLLFDT